jgi:phage terminase small subunit
MLRRSAVNSPRPPRHLTAPTRAWFSQVCERYELEEHHLKLLTLAAESWDRCCAARLAIAKRGLTYTDRFGAPHPRPEVSIERDSRTSFARLIRELDLDLSAPQEPRRLPPLTSNRK